MGWTLGKQGADWVWRCSSYTDLQSGAINNFAEYGQPYSPYQWGKFNHDFYDKRTDFSKVVIEMPQIEVMLRGYGRSTQPEEFEVVKRFLAGDIKVPDGKHSFQDLVRQGQATARQRYIQKNLYKGLVGFGDPGTIDATEAAYVHGTVGLALMAGTEFVAAGKKRAVNAEIGALDDNWDFESSNGLADRLNPVVGLLVGPEHNNLTKPIRIRYTGGGARRSTSATLR